MMKLFYNLQRGVGLLVFCTILLSACVNHISEEEEDSVNNGDIPLKFIADIRESVGTRMANNNFAEGDEVGLFALAGTTTMQEERYVDNLHFIRSSNGEFESNSGVLTLLHFHLTICSINFRYLSVSLFIYDFCVFWSSEQLFRRSLLLLQELLRSLP